MVKMMVKMMVKEVMVVGVVMCHEDGEWWRMMVHDGVWWRMMVSDGE